VFTFKDEECRENIRRSECFSGTVQAFENDSPLLSFYLLAFQCKGQQRMKPCGQL